MTKMKLGDNLKELLDKIKVLEDEVVKELQRKEKEFLYKIRGKKVEFEDEIKNQHKFLIKSIPQYLRDAPILNILISPVVYAGIFPAVLMDLFATIFQTLCFPIYGIPKVRRNEYIIIDRQYLHYLNGIEKLNCMFCGYFNGVMAFVREIAARTEQYFCPVKHARKLVSTHSRYNKFIEYGDGEEYRKRLDEICHSFDDIIQTRKKQTLGKNVK